MIRAAFQITVVASCLLCATASAHAQFIRGTVVHAHTEEPLENVTVELIGPGDRQLGRAVTNSSGAFNIQSARTGEYTLRASRIGLDTVSAPLSVGVSQRVEIVLRMAESPLPMEALTVEARRSLNIGSLAGYYERIERSQLLGIGTVLTRDWIVDRRAGTAADILRQQPRISVESSPYGTGQVRFTSGGRAGCIPQIYLDGILANRSGPMPVNELPRPADLEGIEIYRGLAEMGEFYDNTGCGVILFWTRRTGDDAPPFTWRRLLSLGVAVSLMYLLIQSH